MNCKTPEIYLQNFWLENLYLIFKVELANSKLLLFRNPAINLFPKNVHDLFLFGYQPLKKNSPIFIYKKYILQFLQFYLIRQTQILYFLIIMFLFIYKNNLLLLTELYIRIYFIFMFVLTSVLYSWFYIQSKNIYD